MMAAESFSPVSPEEYHYHISRWIRPFELHTRGWRAGRTHLDYFPLRQIAAIKVFYGTPIEVRRARLEKFYILHIPIKGSFSGCFNGYQHEIRGSTALLIPPNTDVELVFPGGIETLLLRIDEHFFKQCLSRLGNVRMCTYLSGDHYRTSLSGGSGRALCQALHHLIAEAGVDSPSIREVPDFLDSLEKVITYRIIAAFGSLESMPESIGKSNRASFIVTRATSFMSHHMDERLTIAQVACHCNTSPRTLQRTFLDIYGMSPLVWFRRTRLHGVRNDLLTGVNDADNVTSIALAWGFSDLGRFALQYRELFGERPSETLRCRKR